MVGTEWFGVLSSLKRLIGPNNKRWDAKSDPAGDNSAYASADRYENRVATHAMSAR